MLVSGLIITGFWNHAEAGGGPIAHDIDFEITDFSVTGTRRLPLGFALQEVDTRIPFELNTTSSNRGNTIIREDGDGDLILELGENTFVESSFVFRVDISFEDIDSSFNFVSFPGGPAVGSVILFEAVEFSMIDDNFVAQCSVGVGVFGGCGVLIDTDDYDLETPNDPLLLGFDVNNDMADDEITTRTAPGVNELRVPGLEIDFGNNPDTTIVDGVVIQDYIVSIDWLININPDADIALVGTASLTTIPVLAAVWLFGSALLGLAGLSRRKTAS